MPAGQSGNIAVKRPHPVIFLEYWKNEEATKKKFVGDWLVTGDLGKKDEQGYFWFVGRSDDVIKCSGYRIGICSQKASFATLKVSNMPY